MDYKDEVESEKRKKIIRIVEEGQKSEYWSILESEVKKLIKRNELYLEGFNKKAFKGDDEIKEHTKLVIATNFMRWFLNLNEKIINDNLSFFRKMERFAKETYNRVNSFVKK
jgi:hypothetical protein